jgi:hypothetical protein
MNTIAGTRSTLGTLHDQGCRTTAGQALCVLHFAEGGTPGGAWTVVVRKTSIPAARVKVSVVFNKNQRSATTRRGVATGLPQRCCV